MPMERNVVAKATKDVVSQKKLSNLKRDLHDTELTKMTNMTKNINKTLI